MDDAAVTVAAHHRHHHHSNNNNNIITEDIADRSFNTSAIHGNEDEARSFRWEMSILGGRAHFLRIRLL